MDNDIAFLLALLIGDLDDADVYLRIRAIRRLLRLGDDAGPALDALKRVVESDMDPDVRIAAAHAVSHIAGAAPEHPAGVDSPVHDEPIGRREEAYDDERFPVGDFQQAVERRWLYKSLSEEIEWRIVEADHGCKAEAAPVVQEIVGSENDGRWTWVGFRFDLSGFAGEPGVELESVVALSRCTGPTPMPYLGVAGLFFGRPFAVKIYLEPFPGAVPTELIDVVNQEVRPIPKPDRRS